MTVGIYTSSPDTIEEDGQREPRPTSQSAQRKA